MVENAFVCGFNPRFYNYPSLQIYITGITLKISQFLNFIELRNNKDFYLDNSKREIFGIILFQLDLKLFVITSNIKIKLKI